jgi:hypothetical protein
MTKMDAPGLTRSLSLNALKSKSFAAVNAGDHV